MRTPKLHSILLSSFVATLLAAGCAPRALAVGAEHPANPDAPPGRLAGPPPALRAGVAEPTPTTEAPAHVHGAAPDPATPERASPPSSAPTKPAADVKPPAAKPPASEQPPKQPAPPKRPVPPKPEPKKPVDPHHGHH